MEIRLFIKGETQFGRRQIHGLEYEYEFEWFRPKKGDLLMFYFPDGNSLGIYQASHETNSFIRQDYQVFTGRMIRFNGTINEFLENHREKSPKVCAEIERLVLKVLDKYGK